jgi:hypothetical protein
MANYSMHDRGIMAKPWFPFVKYGALIALAGLTGYVVFMALTK